MGGPRLPGDGDGVNRVYWVGGKARHGSAVAMVGPRLFRSRWSALLWAGGILWTAYDVAEAIPDRTAASASGTTDATGNATANAGEGAVVDATGVAVDARDLAVLANVGTAD